MGLHIDWDTYEVIEREDFDLTDLENIIEDVRETMDNFAGMLRSIPEALEDLLVELTDLEEEIHNGTN